MIERGELRERLRNWSRVYRTSIYRSESNIAPLLRRLKLYYADPVVRHFDDSFKRSPDERDAALIDAAILKLPNEERNPLRTVIVAEYGMQFSSESFESTADMKRISFARARCCQLPPRLYEIKLQAAEELLGQIVEKIESRFEDID